MSTFSLVDATGKKLFETSYNSTRYLQYYLGNFTFAPDEDLGDWDFFVAVKRAVEELKIIAKACTVISADSRKTGALTTDVVIADTGTACPRAVVWAACLQMETRCRPSVNEALPDVDGRSGPWVWIGPA